MRTRHKYKRRETPRKSFQIQTMAWRTTRPLRRYKTGYSRKPGSWRNYRTKKGSNSRTLVVTKNANSSSATRYPPRSMNKISTHIYRNLPTLWPDKTLIKMKYVDTNSITLTFAQNSQVPQTLRYRVNSLYDPNIATALEQPIAGFAELAAMYTSYRVHAAKMSVRAESASGSVPTLAVCTLANQNNFPSTYLQTLASIGNPYTVWDMMGLGVGASGLTLENYCKMDKLAGTKNISTDMGYSSAVTTNPLYQLYGFVTMSPTFATGAGYSVAIVIEIEFWAEFFGREVEFS